MRERLFYYSSLLMPSRTPIFRPAVYAVAVLAVLCARQVHAQKNPEVVAQQLLERYRALDGLRAGFTQAMGTARFEGTLTVRGDAFRIEMDRQTLVTDGTTLWSFSADDNQVVVQDYNPADLGFSIGQVFTDYLSVFRPTGATRAAFDGVNHDVLALVPRSATTSVRDATLYVRSSDAIPTRVRVHDINGRSLAFDLHNVVLNPRLPTGTFTFRPQQGVEVIDLRS